MRDIEHEQVDSLIKLFPGPIRLTCEQPSPRQFMPLVWISAAISLMLVIGGIANAANPKARFLLGIGVAFALGAALVFVCIKAQSGQDRQLDTLLLDADGFHTAGPGAIGSFAWQDVDKFYVFYNEDAPNRTAFRLFESEDCPRYFPRKHKFERDYGLSAAALAAVMEAWTYAAWRHRNPPKYKSAAHD